MPIGGIISGIGSIFGGSQAASAGEAQAAAQRHAADLQFQEFGQIQNNMQPFLQGGTSAFDALLNYWGVNPSGGNFPTVFNAPISDQVGPPPSPTDPNLQTLGGFTMGPPPNPADPALRSAFRSSPGYGFLINEMTNAVQNSAAGRTGALSGPMLEALQTRAAGIADQDWNNWYNQDVASWANGNTNWWNIYNALGQNYGQRYQDVANQRNTLTSVLGSFAGAGQNAAANLGGFGQAAATSIGNAGIGAANARAAGNIGATNAFTSGGQQIGNAFSSLFNPNGSGGNNGLNFLLGGNSGGYDPSAVAMGGVYNPAYGGGYDYGGGYAGV